MMSLNELLIEITTIKDESVIHEFIHKGWVRPQQPEKPWQFDEMDLARIRLIHQLQYEFMVEEDTIPVVLSLLDQLYGTRQQMKKLCQAIAKQPRSIQAEIFSCMDDDNKK